VGLGTLLVAALYLGVNAVFLRTTPAEEMAGKPEVALVAGAHIFGATGGKVAAGLICAGLVSTISAMLWVGSRVAATMGEDVGAFRWLAQRNAQGVPARAVAAQAAIASGLLAASFDEVLTYVQFTLLVSSFLTVLGVLVLRHTEPDLPRPYKAWGYPLTPLVFLAIVGWMMVHVVRSKPTESLAGLGTMALGLVVFLFSSKAPRAPEY
jgi:APA family basic amino acid/polyamine antiporter